MADETPDSQGLRLGSLVQFGAFCLAAADGATVGGFVGFAGFSASQTALHSSSRDLLQSSGFGGIGSLGMYFGFIALGFLGFWPLRGDPGPARSRAVALMSRMLVVLHPAALAALAWAIWQFGYAASAFVFLSVPLAILATPLLVPVSRMAFSVEKRSPPPPNLPPQRKHAAPSTADHSRHTDALVALLLPFVAAFRAGQPWLGGISLLLWVGGLLFLLLAPLRGIVFLSLATGIGVRAAASARPLPPRVAEIARTYVSPLPPEAAAGLLSVPPLLTLDILAAAAAFAIARTGSPESAVSVMTGLTLLLTVALPFTVLVSMALLIAGMRMTEALRPPLCVLLALAHLALTLFFAALGLSASLGSLGVDAPEPTRTLARPMALALIAGLPLAVTVVISGTRGGRAQAH